MEDEENLTETEDKVQQVSPKTPRRQVQKNHPLYQISGKKDARVKTKRRIYSLEKTHLVLLSTIEKIVLKKPSRMNFGIRPWLKNWIK
jgi:hypothetical protein